MGPSFPEVLTAAQLGADWAWAALYRSIAGPLNGYVRAHGATDPEAVVGDVFLSLARGIAAFTGDEAGFRSWAFVVAHRRVIDDRRRRRLRPQHEVSSFRDHADPPGGDVEEEAIARLTEIEALALLEDLTALQRDVLLLRFVADLSIEDVARTLGRPITAVKAAQRRAISSIRRRAEGQGYPGPTSER